MQIVVDGIIEEIVLSSKMEVHDGSSVCPIKIVVSSSLGQEEYSGYRYDHGEGRVEYSGSISKFGICGLIESKFGDALTELVGRKIKMELVETKPFRYKFLR